MIDFKSSVHKYRVVKVQSAGFNKNRMGKNIIINIRLLLYHPSWQAWSTLVFIGLKSYAVNYHVKFEYCNRVGVTILIG